LKSSDFKIVPGGAVSVAAIGIMALSAFIWWVLSSILCGGPYVGLNSEGACSPSDSIAPLLSVPAVGAGAVMAWLRQKWWPFFAGAGLTLIPIVMFLSFGF
jgi:hypothetical protein